MKVKYLAFMIILLPVVGWPQVAPKKVGTVGAQFLELGIGARPTAIGQAYVAVGKDASSIFWNPAGSANLSKLGVKNSLFLSYTKLFLDMQHNAFAYAARTGFGTVGIFGVFFNSGEMLRTTTEQPEGIGTFAYNAYSVGVNYSKWLTDRFAFGLNVKLVAEDYGIEAPLGGGPVDISTIAVDMGTFYYTEIDSIVMAMSIQHFAPDVRPTGKYWVDVEGAPTVEDIFRPYPFPIRFLFGIAFPIHLGQNGRLLASVEGRHTSDAGEQFNVGLEYSFRNFFFVRGGYRFNIDEGGLSFGVGFIPPLGGLRLGIDYSFVDWGRLPDVQRVSTSIVF